MNRAIKGYEKDIEDNLKRFAGFNLTYGNKDLSYFKHMPINNGDE